MEPGTRPALDTVFSAPKDCVQGADFPFYARWNPERRAAFRLVLPKGISIKELYNVRPEDIAIESSGGKETIDAKQFEVNGYVGGVCSTEVLDQHRAVERLEFKLVSPGEAKAETKMVELFRAAVTVDHVPKQIRIRTDERGRFHASAGIALRNQGRGTGLVILELREDNEVKEGEIAHLQEFYAAFGVDLRKNLQNLRGQFPEHSEAVDLWITYLDHWSKQTRGEFQQTEVLEQKLRRAQEVDEKFREACAKVVVDAYFKNMRIFTDVDHFLSYLSSIKNKGIILLNPLKSLKVTASPAALRASLQVIDLVPNIYDPISLDDISLVADKDCVVPVYELIAGSAESSRS